ncbi:hypothetical protein DV737_g3311, partial [Chaetothyriales sp. CBS 132003]
MSDTKEYRVEKSVADNDVEPTSGVHSGSARSSQKLEFGQSGWTNEGVQWCIGLLSITSVLTGFDGVLHLSDEIPDAPVKVPYAMIWAVILNTILALGFLITLLFCIGDVDAAINTPTGFPVIQILYNATQSKAGTTIIICMILFSTMIALFVVFASVSRLAWAFARDNGLPFSSLFAYVYPRLRIPLNALGLVTTIAALLGLSNIGNTTAFIAILSLATVGLYFSYVMPLAFALLRKLQGRHPPYGPFRLGIWSIPVNVAGLAFGIFIVIFLPFPPMLPVTGATMNYVAPILGAVVVLALVDWFVGGRKRFDSPSALDSLQAAAMATPTRSQAVSTPKSHLPSTPSRPMASPRPGSSAVAHKSLAYKSPAVKTPASAHSHAYAISVSSQPSSTPLAVAAIHDELLALNSPAAALINSIVPSGLTPLPGGPDGLDITTPGQNALSASREGPLAGDPEAQRLARLQQAMASLKSKAIGRGVTRESVERVARLQGFEALWDEDILTIAGNIVEIEIHFGPLDRDRIADLVLKLNPADGDSQTQREAADILKKQVGAGSATDDGDLEAFARNMGYLAQMDRVAVQPNAFELTDSLSQTLSRIWDEEKKRMSWRTELYHTRKGAFGRVHYDEMPSLGLTVDYWHARPYDEDMAPVFRAKFACGTAAPGILASQTWLTAEVLAGEPKADSVFETQESILVPDWKLDATQPDSASADPQHGHTQPDKPLAPTVDAHFLCELEPEILLPHNVALKLNSQVDMLSIDQSRALTYQSALQKHRNIVARPNDLNTTEARWSRRLPVFHPDGQFEQAVHTYALYAAPPNSELWVIPISKLSFSHPKDLAAAIKVLRQYALVWSLLKSLVEHPMAMTVPQAESAGDRRRKVTKRSNKPAATKTAKTFDSSSEPQSNKDSLWPIDVSVDVISDPSRCKIDLFAPLLPPGHKSKGSAGSSGSSSFLHVSLSIGPNATIEVSGLSGLQDTGGGASTDLSTSGLKAKVAKMLDATEDIGIVVQWLLDQPAN